MSKGSDIEIALMPGRLLVRIGIVFGAFALLCLLFTWFGLGRMVFVALLSGLLAGVLSVIGLAAPRVLGPYESDQVRKCCFGAAPTGILMLGILAQMYPASFTPDLMAPRVSIEKLEEHLDSYEGFNIRVEGSIDRMAPAGEGRNDKDEAVQHIDLWLSGGEHKVIARCEVSRDDPVPTVGSIVRVTGIVVVNPASEERYLEANRLQVVAQAGSLAAAN